MNYFLSISLAACFLGVVNSSNAANWPSWRGPAGDGTSPENSFPNQWDKTKNVRWRAQLPERGNSSPIVWGQEVFVTQALEKEGRRELICFNRQNGSVLWRAGTAYAEKEPTHEANPYCPSSPVTDGEVVVASFASAGLFAYDMNGKELWHHNLGKVDHIWGAGASPVISGDRVIMYHGPGTSEFLVALNKKNGQELWRVPTPAYKPGQRFDGFAGKTNTVEGSWSTPILIKNGNREELVMSFVQRLQGLSPQTGKQLWSCEGLNPLIYTSPAYGDGVIVAMGGFSGSTLAVKPGDGDLSGKKIWYEQRAKKNRMGTGVIRSGHIYFVNSDGIAECVELTTGKQIWEERLESSAAKGEVWGSPVLAGDRFYVINQSGDTFVIRAAPKFEVIARNGIGEFSNSTPALSDGEIFLRTYEGLWCISEQKQTARVQ